MTDHTTIDVSTADAGEPLVRAVLDMLTAELALGGYSAGQTFGYSASQLEDSAVHLVAARAAGGVIGVGGIELQDGHRAELKRFLVTPEHRGTGVADALIASLLAHAATRGARVVALETGDRQLAARAFYRRHGFVEVPRFAPYVESTTSVCRERVVADDVLSEGRSRS